MESTDKVYTENYGKYSRLSAEEGGKIEAYRSLNCSISKIAGLINRSKSTVWEEIKRRKYNGRYTAHIAQNRAEKKGRESHKRFGDWEADMVISYRGGRSCLAVFVEQESRLYRLAKMQEKSVEEMLAATIRTLKNQGVKTMTYDNGTENANHEFANNILNCKSFFFNAYHSWEKGSIENHNKILRQFFPKGTNFDLISDEEIRKVQMMINDRPMETLN